MSARGSAVEVILATAMVQLKDASMWTGSQADRALKLTHPAYTSSHVHRSQPEDQRDTLMVEARHVARDALGEPSANSFRTSGLGEQGWNGLFGEGGTL